MKLRSSLTLIIVLALMVPALAAAAGPKEKMEVCHVPPGNPDNAHTINVSPNAWKAHKAHGDTEGECPDERRHRDDDDDSSDHRDDDDDSSDDKTSENRAPIARAGADRCVEFGGSYELDGTESYDPDGAYADLDFDWHVINRPDGSDFEDEDLSPNEFDDDPMFEPDLLGEYRFALTVKDADNASDTDVVNVDVYIDVDLDDTEYEVVEDETVAVEITLGEAAPQDVEVSLAVDDDVVVFVENSNDDEGDEITKVTIDEGDDDVTVYLYGLEDTDDDDESTDITVSVGSNDCGASDTASVDVEDDDEKAAFDTTQSLQLDTAQRLQLFVIRLLAFRIV